MEMIEQMFLLAVVLALGFTLGVTYKERKRKDPKEEIYAPEIWKLHEDFTKIIEERFGRDEDGDLRVEVMITDRSRQLPLHWFNIPYPWKIETHEERVRALSLAFANVGIAKEQCRQIITGMEMDIERDT